jgi:hypothetical protein
MERRFFSVSHPQLVKWSYSKLVGAEFWSLINLVETVQFS